MLKSLLFILISFFTLNALALTQGLEYHQASLKKRLFKSLDASFKYDQKLDHNDPESVMFKQRYFVDSSNAENLESPVFYIICGEWNCGGAGSYGYATNLAKKFKAHLVALEHRFYGESLPTNNLTTENLKFLNLESAIADLATFQKFMMEDKGLKGKWVAFGGSYAGTLSAYYRIKHPELIVGSLASSAPVYMKPEFSEYDAHIAKVIGTSSCGDKVRAAVSLIENKMLTPEGVLEVKTQFKATDVRDDLDFLYVVADMLAAAVQYGKDKVFCDALAKNSDLVQGYADGGLKVLASMGMSPVEISLQAAEKVETGANDYLRQWMWQSCSEFGWFQVSNQSGETSRSVKVDLKYHENVCQRLFQTPMTASVSFNDLWFMKLSLPESSHVLFTNGSNDPWLTLSLIPGVEINNPGFDLYMMEGANHCTDLKAYSALSSVTWAQEQMAVTIGKWIKSVE